MVFNGYSSYGAISYSILWSKSQGSQDNDSLLLQDRAPIYVRHAVVYCGTFPLYQIDIVSQALRNLLRGYTGRMR